MTAFIVLACNVTAILILIIIFQQKTIRDQAREIKEQTDLSNVHIRIAKERMKMVYEAMGEKEDE